MYIVPGVWSIFLDSFYGYQRFSPQRLVKSCPNGGSQIEKLVMLGGLSSFLCRCVWIAVFEGLILAEVFRFRESPRKGEVLQLYSRLLKVALHGGSLILFMHLGLAVLIRKP